MSVLEEMDKAKNAERREGRQATEGGKACIWKAMIDLRHEMNPEHVQSGAKLD